MTKSLVLLGEGEGDRQGLPELARRVIGVKQGWDVLRLDTDPLTVHQGIPRLTRHMCAEWLRLLRVALKSRKAGAVLAVLDGDLDHFPVDSRTPFCAAAAAKAMAEAARAELGAGQRFSVAVVIACQEYESWLIAGVATLAGKKLSDGRDCIRKDAAPPVGNLEQAPRNAKGWLGKNSHNGYSATSDQSELTKLVDLAAIRARPDMISFRRLEHAIEELIGAMRTGQHICTPS